MIIILRFEKQNSKVSLQNSVAATSVSHCLGIAQKAQRVRLLSTGCAQGEPGQRSTEKGNRPTPGCGHGAASPRFPCSPVPLLTTILASERQH